MSKVKNITLSEVKKQWMTNPAFRAEYDALADEYALAAAFIDARAKAGITQAEIAQRMGTKQSAIARLESGKAPSWKSIERYAKALGMRPVIHFESVKG